MLIASPQLFSAVINYILRRILFLNQLLLLPSLSHLLEALLVFPGSSRGRLHVRVADASSPTPVPVLLSAAAAATATETRSRNTHCRCRCCSRGQTIAQGMRWLRLGALL